MLAQSYKSKVISQKLGVASPQLLNSNSLLTSYYLKLVTSTYGGVY